ncbi:MAG TPA: SRPBCC family protein [Epsilonproteobacteria bacterium]|nr:SRPBCC family protein [Campylobacterota bacterium]
MNLANVHYEMLMEASTQKVWNVIRQYGDVSKFHAGVERTTNVNGSSSEAYLGADRVCDIHDMGMNIILKEKIIDFKEGESYRYEVYETKNFPVQELYFEFRIRRYSDNRAYLRLDIDYKGKPAFITPFLKPKMQKLSRDVLLGYKEHIETGSKNVPIKELRKKYQSA